VSGFSEIFWEQQSGLPLLILLQLLPLLGAALVFAFQERASAVVVGKVVALGELLLAIVATSRIDPLHPALQLAERFGPLAYHVAVDGLSLIFLLVAALLTLLLMLYGMSRGMISPGRLYAVLLIAEAGLVGMLLTLNVAWFAFYSALELWAVVYLLRRWASSRAEIHALSRFIQYQSFGWLLFAAGCLVLGWGHAEATGGRWSFDLFDLVGAVPVGKFQTAAFYLLFYGLAAEHGAAWLDRRRPGPDGRRQGRHLRHAALRAAADAGGGAVLAAVYRRFRHGRHFLYRGARLPADQPAPAARLRRGQPYQPAGDRRVQFA
jgi:NADH-quinone oxidoreductase subunit M